MHHAERAHEQDPVARALARAHGLLPDQGPIGVFVHHNTLHAFQGLPFHDGVQQGAAVIGARPYLDLHEYRDAWRRSRIEDEDVDATLVRALDSRGDERLPLSLSRRALWRAMLRDVLDEDDGAGLTFLAGAGGASLHGASLHQAAAARIARASSHAPVEAPVPARHRDALVALGGADTDVVVHGELVRLAAVFLDHGQALAAMPKREAGFLSAVAALYRAGAPEPRGCPGVRDDLLRADERGADARIVIAATLDLMGVPEEEREPFLVATALALPGWTGMFARLERHPEEVHGPARVLLADMLAVRLLHEWRAVQHAAAAIGVPARWPALQREVCRTMPSSPEREAWMLAGIAESAGAGASDLAALDDGSLALLWSEVAALPRVRRRALLHEAYERRYRRQILDGLHLLRAQGVPRAEEPTPDAQFVFCIDEREESVRRAIEEQGERFETFGVAGFFGVAIDYLGLYDETPAAHCPVVITPAHEVHESARPASQHWHLKRLGLRDRWRAASRLVHRQSRTLGGGAGLSFLLGPLAAALAVSRVVAPRTSLALADDMTHRFAPRPDTQLSAMRGSDDADGSRSARGKLVGFALDEAADRVAGVLRAIGMTRRFAPIVIVLGHGSTSLNNPHESAHDCGACGGRRGGTNARLFAEMANNPDIRRALIDRGIRVPDGTWFVGGLHDTASDAVTLYDLELMPVGHADAFRRAHDVLDRARRESAAERCRRFDDTPLGIGPDAALRHVEARSSHLAQPRPEYGHCTNAICIVGRRAISRGLHFDRRAFLVSYDPTQDTEAATLERILAAVGPVGAGISLEYYFSSVDNERFGCGTKLPHNVTGLVGVMAGHQSDLRTGLPIQMVEIHEPMRLLLVVDATPESLLAVAGRQPEVAELVVNEWVQLVSYHPETGAMMVFQDGGFIPYEPGNAPLPEVTRSPEWHTRARGHLPPALVHAALARDPMGSALARSA